MNTDNPLHLSASPRLRAIIVLAPLLLAGVCQLVKASQSLHFHGDNTFPESAVVQTAEWSRETGRVYPSLAQSPYTPAPYGPLFYLSLSTLARTTNAGFDQIMFYGRAIVLISFLLLPVLAYRWVRSRGMPPAVALAVAAIVLAQIDFLDWNISVRPDMLALLFTFAAFYLLAGPELSSRNLIAAGVLCGIAALFKQSFIALPFAAFVWLVWNRRWRNALLFAGGGLAIAAAVLGYLGLRHEPFLQEALLARHSPVSAFAAILLLNADFLHYPWQIILLVLGILGVLWMPNGNALRRFSWLYLLLAWLAGFYTAMAPGANVNAFLEAWVLSAALAAYALNQFIADLASVPASARALLLVLWIAVSVVSLEAWRIPMSSRPPAMYGELAALARGHRVLSDFPYVTAHGKQPELLDPSVNHYLELAKYWSPQPVLEELQKQEFDYVIVGMSGGQPRQWRGLTLFSGSILKEISADYRLTCVSDRFAIYVPVKRTVLDPGAEGLLQTLGCTATTAPALPH